MYAIINTGGKQYKVAEGDVITVEKLAQAEGEAVVFDQVLAVVNDGDVKVGKPVVEGAKVTAKVEAQGKERKIHIVCAGVSALAQSALWGIGEYLHREVDYGVASGKLSMKLKGDPDDLTEAVLQPMLFGLTEIAKISPKAVRINERL